MNNSMKMISRAAILLVMIGLRDPLIHAQDLSKYRNFAFGMNSASVLKLAEEKPADLITIHAQPALIQELTWYPPLPFASPRPAEPVQKVLFSFYNGELYRMVVTYDTGGKAITEDLGIKLENVKIEDLGHAKKIVIDKDNTTIIEGAGKNSEIESRIKQLRTQIGETTSDYDGEKLQERLAKLVGGVAVIKVGAATETELKEKKARVEDAMHATRAAVEEGIVPGGGVALLRCIPVLEKLKLLDDEANGVNIVKRALEEPIRQMAHNAGHEGAVIVRRVCDSKDDNFGFNAETGEFGDMLKAGVIDPAKVTRLALQNAASIAALMLTTEALIAEFKEEEKAVAVGAGQGGMGGMY